MGPSSLRELHRARVAEQSLTCPPEQCASFFPDAMYSSALPTTHRQMHRRAPPTVRVHTIRGAIQRCSARRVPHAQGNRHARLGKRQARLALLGVRRAASATRVRARLPNGTPLSSYITKSTSRSISTGRAPGHRTECAHRHRRPRGDRAQRSNATSANRSQLSRACARRPPMCGPIQPIGAQAWHANNGVAAARGCRAPLGPSPPLGLREVRAEVRECLQSYTVSMPTPGSRAEGKKAWIKSRSVQSRSARARAGMGKLKRAVVANTSSIVMVVLPNTLSGLT